MRDTRPEQRINFSLVDKNFFAMYVLFYFENDPRLMSIGSGVDERTCAEFMHFGFSLDNKREASITRDLFMRLCGAMKINPRRFYSINLWGYKGRKH